MQAEITRLAPSPTGALHLGNARTFLINWLLARQNGWSIPLRIEDLDGPRIKRGAVQQSIDDLKWLGIDWDGEPTYQSWRTAEYKKAIDRLLASGAAYPCVCSRRETESSASAPHAEDGSHRYPGTCRGRFTSIEQAKALTGRDPSIRFAVPDGVVHFHDLFAGEKKIDVAKELGDFVIAKADGSPAYQLAVVVDDAAAGVTQVVRGDDLLESAARQMLVYRALNLSSQIPTYTHLPLIVGEDGHRLAKRHGDSRLSHYRATGVRAVDMISLLARWCGVGEFNELASARDLVDRFQLSQVSHDPIVFSASDERLLLSGIPR